MRVLLILFTLAVVGMAVWSGLGVQTESMLTETFRLSYGDLEILPLGLEFDDHDLVGGSGILFVMAALMAIGAGCLGEGMPLLWLPLYVLTLLLTSVIAFIWGLYLGASFMGIVVGLAALSALLFLLIMGIATLGTKANTATNKGGNTA